MEKKHHDSLITERELTHFFHTKSNKNPKSGFQFAIRELLIMICVFALTFIIINYPALSNKSRYWWQIQFLNKKELPNKNIKTPEPSAPNQIIAKISIPNNRIQIQRLGIDVPVIWDIPENQIHSELNNGVVHYKDSAHPNETGNIFIVGHSSDYIWSKGLYKNIFSIINQLVQGDKILLSYQDQTYEYIVQTSKIISPFDTSVLKPTPDQTLTLMTCWPVGTSQKRLVVIAKPIIQNQNTLQQTSPQTNKLPSVR